MVRNTLVIAGMFVFLILALWSVVPIFLYALGAMLYECADALWFKYSTLIQKRWNTVLLQNSFVQPVEVGVE